MERSLVAPPRDRLDWQNSKRPSKITIPKHAHPFAKFLFAEMNRQRVTYAELEHRSGVLVSTFKAYRTDNTPGLTSIEAALGAVGWTLVPVPKLDTLEPELAKKLDRLGKYFRSREEAFGAAVLAAATWPEYAATHQPRQVRALAGK